MVSIRKKFNSYKSFAGKSIEEILNKEMLRRAEIQKVHTLSSGFLRNTNGQFEFIPFGAQLQLAPILEFVEFDFDNDGKTEILAAGNYFGIKPYHGRLDSFPGALINNEDDYLLGNTIGLDFMFKSIRHLNIINLNGRSYLLATFNDEDAQVYEIIK